MKGGTKLWSMISMYKEFCDTSKNTSPECGQSYAMAASRIGTIGIMPKSTANAMTLENLSVCCIVIPCIPITTIFTWEYCSVVPALHPYFSTPAAANWIWSKRWLLGNSIPPSVVRESNQFWRLPALLHDFLPMFRLFAMMDWSCPTATLDSSKGSDDAYVVETNCRILLLRISGNGWYHCQ